MIKSRCKHIVFCFIPLLGCVEPFDIEARDTTGILVVEATITDELKKHLVFLSRTSNLDNVNVDARDTLDVSRPIVRTVTERINPEVGADVTLIDGDGTIVNFEEISEGVYQSENPIALVSDQRYQLQISTANNETYESNFESIVGKSELRDVYAEFGVSENGEEGVFIYVDGTDAIGQSDYFRFNYEETYKIIAPNFTGKELEIIREEQVFIEDGTILFPDMKVVTVEDEERVCFNSDKSRTINLTNTNNQTGSDIERHMVRFLGKSNPIISHRYSILVEQYVMNSEAYNFYENLGSFAQSESVFSAVQPGFLEGNLRRKDIENGMVLGYFEVASLSRQRLFFDYVDFFPDQPLPPYFGNTNCTRTIAPALGNPERDGPQPLGCPPPALIRRVKSNEISYFGENDEPGECEGPYLMTPSICADCTLLGSNVIPEFWTEE